MAENNVTITWDNTPIEIIDRDSLELNKIDDNGTIGEMIDTINANFQNIAKHGGGPAGKDGTNGTNGVDGTSAEYIYALSDVMEPGEQYPLDDLGKEKLFERVHNGEHAGFPEGDSNITWYEHAQPITEDQKNEYVLIRYKTSFRTWVYERTPVLWAHWGESGTDGADSIYIDLDNEMDSIQIDTDNKVLIGRIFETRVSLYSGANKIKMKEIDVSGEDGISCTRHYYNGNTEVNGVTSANMASKNIDSVVLVFTLETDQVLTSVSTKIVISATSLDDITRKASYTIAGVTLPSVYTLIPSATSIIKNNNTLSVSEVSVDVVEITGDTSNTYKNGISGDSKFKVYVQKTTGTTTGTKEDITSTFVKSTSGLNVGDKLTFTIEVDTDGNNTYETVVDKETIFVLLQGENGDSINRVYAQYDNSWGTYKDIVSINSSGSTVTFKNTSNTNKTASTTTSPNGADASHCVEVMSEKIGDGSWSFPIISSRYFSQDEVAGMVNASLTDSNETLVRIINEKAGEAVSDSLGGYATTEWVGNNYQAKGNYATSDQIPSLEGYAKTSDIPTDYVNSTTFTTYKSDAAKRTASAEMITANSTFAKDSDGYLILANGNSSTFKDTSSTSAIEAYYNSLSTSDKNALNSGAGTDETGSWYEKPTVVKNLINKMKSVFRLTFTELASVSTRVGDKMSEAQIIAAINNGSNTIKAAMTAWANSDGSGINLGADHIAINSSHTLNVNSGGKIDVKSGGDLDVESGGEINIKSGADLNIASGGDLNISSGGSLAISSGGTFTLNAPNLTISNTGIVTAKGIKISSTNNKTYIGSDGILHAEGAVIEGDITANKFMATKVNGSITKTTTMTGDEMSIVATGSGTNNAIFFTIVDSVTNTNSQISGSTLTNVPTLCMRYNGTDYILSPASWVNPNITPENTSNMRWIKMYDTVDYSFTSNPSTTYCLTGSCTTSNTGVAGTYYLFSPDNRTRYISSNGSNQIYQLQAFDLGGSTYQDSSLTLLKNSGLVTSSATASNVKSCGAYTLGSRVLSGKGYSTTETTKITSDACSTYAGYLKSSIETGGDYYTQKHFTSSSTEFGMNKLASLILSACSSYSMTRWVSEWGPTMGAFNDYLSKSLPFAEIETSNVYNTPNVSKFFNLNISYRPIISITNSGKNVSSSVNKIWVTFRVEMYGEYSNANRISIESSYDGTSSSSYLTITSADLILDFDVMFNFTGSISGFNPADGSSTNHDLILSKINTFLKNFNFNNISDYNTVQNFSFSGTITTEEGETWNSVWEFVQKERG